MKQQKDNNSSLLKEIREIHREIKGFIRKHVRAPHPYDLFKVVGEITLYIDCLDRLCNNRRCAQYLDLYAGDTIGINKFDVTARQYFAEIIANSKNGETHEVFLDESAMRDMIRGGWIELVN